MKSTKLSALTIISLTASLLLGACSEKKSAPKKVEVQKPSQSPLRTVPLQSKAPAPTLSSPSPTFKGFNDPVLKQQTSLKTINAFKAYEILFSGPNALRTSVKIGMIDRGLVNADHFDLQGQLLPGSDTTTARREVDHGQHVLGIMAAKANNGFGTAGVAGINAKFLFKTIPYAKDKKGANIANLTTVAKMLRDMGAQGIDAINLSFGANRPCKRSFGDCIHPIAASPTVLAAMKETAQKFGTIFVISAGNDSEKIPIYSAPSDGILVVGAVNLQHRRSDYSNYGPGVNMSATDSGVFGLSFTGYANNESFENGTSFTAPLVTAAAALIKGYLNQNGTKISAADLASLIMRNSNSGELDFGRAAQEAQKLIKPNR